MMGKGNSSTAILLQDFLRPKAEDVNSTSRIFDPKKSIEKAISLREANINRKQQRIYLKLTHKDIEVIGDEDRFMQILTNLLADAIEFTPNQGSITLSVGQFAQTVDQTILQVMIESEESNGTEEPTLSSQFDSEGTVQKLVEQLGGKIAGDHQRWKKKFEFTVPFKTVSKEQLFQPASPIFEPLSPRRKLVSAAPTGLEILIVEDDPINQRLLTKQLEPEGYHCYVVDNGLEAVEFFKKTPVNLILMNIRMPVMNGLEATKALRALEKEPSWQRAPVPIIGLSGYIRQEQKEEALSTGMNDYLTKPYEKTALLEKMTRYKSVHSPFFQREPLSASQTNTSVPKMQL